MIYSYAAKWVPPPLGLLFQQPTDPNPNTDRCRDDVGQRQAIDDNGQKDLRVICDDIRFAILIDNSPAAAMQKLNLLNIPAFCGDPFDIEARTPVPSRLLCHTHHCHPSP